MFLKEIKSEFVVELLPQVNPRENFETKVRSFYQFVQTILEYNLYGYLQWQKGCFYAFTFWAAVKVFLCAWYRLA